MYMHQLHTNKITYQLLAGDDAKMLVLPSPAHTRTHMRTHSSRYKTRSFPIRDQMSIFFFSQESEAANTLDCIPGIYCGN